MIISRHRTATPSRDGDGCRGRPGSAGQPTDGECDAAGLRTIRFRSLRADGVGNRLLLEVHFRGSPVRCQSCSPETP